MTANFHALSSSLYSEYMLMVLGFITTERVSEDHVVIISHNTFNLV